MPFLSSSFQLSRRCVKCLRPHTSFGVAKTKKSRAIRQPGRVMKSLTREGGATEFICFRARFSILNQQCNIILRAKRDTDTSSQPVYQDKVCLMCVLFQCHKLASFVEQVHACISRSRCRSALVFRSKEAFKGRLGQNVAQLAPFVFCTLSWTAAEGVNQKLSSASIQNKYANHKKKLL